MSCTHTMRSPSVTIPTPIHAEMDQPGFLTIVIDALQEALSMRRAAHERYFLGDE